jgi:hypothetical protein
LRAEKTSITDDVVSIGVVSFTCQSVPSPLMTRGKSKCPRTRDGVLGAGTALCSTIDPHAFVTRDAVICHGDDINKHVITTARRQARLVCVLHEASFSFM